MKRCILYRTAGLLYRTPRRSRLRILGALAFAAVVGQAGPRDEGDPGKVSAFLFEKGAKVKTTINLKEVHRGTRKPNPRDAIPAIFKPRIVPAKHAHWLQGQDRVIGLVINGKARAYAIKILEQHELVNDVLGGRPIAPNY